QICPIFANMFSDLPNHPRKQFIRRKSAPLPASMKGYKSKIHRSVDNPRPKMPDVIGADRCKYFHFPKITLGDKFNVPELQLHHSTPKENSAARAVKTELMNKDEKTQTIFRESSVQTSPWEPSFVVTSDTEPELLKLDFLKWGKARSGLPPGIREVQLLERARIKRAWEERCEVRNPEDLERRKCIIAAMERDEWAFREQEIQDIQDLRLKLLENMLNELHEKSKSRSEAKLEMLAKKKHAEKKRKLQKLCDKTKRELRKLDMKQAGLNPKYHPVNILDEHIDHASEIYGVEDFNTLPRWLDKATRIKDRCCSKTKGTRLCVKETKWTAPVLKQLHEELLALRNDPIQPCTLLKKTGRVLFESSTPEVEAISDGDEDFYQATVLLQSVIKGRAAQMHQETIDLYLEDIIKEGMEFASAQEAKEYIQKLAKKIDEEAYRMKKNMNVTLNDEEEAVADLVHHFVLPEVEKQLMRSKIQKKQKQKLRTVHDAVYSEIESLPPPEIPSPNEANTSAQKSKEEKKLRVIDKNE
ncbi:MAATS1-like, partial [Asbolus verrucosus]